MNTAQIVVAMLLAAGAGSALAQPAGPGPCMAASGASAPAAACGGGGGGPHARWGKDFTPGWPMMTPEERQAHRERLASFKTYDDCKAYVKQHHDEMAARAKERGRPVPAAPRRDACAPLKAKPTK
jgi:hypothetical protein